MAKINLNCLYTPKGKPYWEDKEREKENRNKAEEIKDLLRWQKATKGKIRW